MSCIHQRQAKQYAKTLWLLLAVCSTPALANNTEDLFELDLEQLLDVEVISATKQSQKLSDAPSIITVITADEIHRMGATTLTDVLTTVPGFTPINQLTSERLMVVRGLNLKDGVLVLIDGVTVNDAFDGSFDFYQRPIDDIERLEVIRGPGSALYGGYAVSAVIHIFSKKARSDAAKYSVQLGGGSFSQKRLSTAMSKAFGGFDDPLQVAASFTWEKQQGDKLKIAQDAIFTPTPAQYLPPLSNPTLTPTVRQEAVEKFNGHVTIDFGKLGINFNHGQLISNPLLSHVAMVTEVGHTIKESTLDRLSMQYSTSFFDDMNFDATAYWVSNEAKLFGQSQPPQIWGDEDQDGLNEDFTAGIIENFRHKTISRGTDLEFNYSKMANHQWLLGLAYNKTRLDEVEKVANVSHKGRGSAAVFPAQDMTIEFMPHGVERAMVSIYLQDLWQVGDNTDVTTGVRFGDYSDFGSTVNPRLGLVHRFNEAWYTKVLYGGAFKPPAFAQLFDATPTLSPFHIKGNRQLKPTKIDTVELQLGYDFSARLKANFSVYDNKTSNEVFFDSTPGIEQWKNSGERRSKGLEIELKGAWLGLDVAYLNFAYQSTQGVEQGAGANIHPAHRINTGGTYLLGDNTSASFTLSYYASPKREANDPRPKIDAKTLLSVALVKENLFEWGLSGKLSISNLFDDDGRDEIEQSVGLVDDIPRQGRTLAFSLGYHF